MRFHLATLLSTSVAALALSSNLGMAQLGGVGVEGIVTSQGKFGGVVSGFLPLSPFFGGMPFVTLQGGVYKNEPVASFGGGYRVLSGNLMYGGHITGDLQGARGSKLLGGMTVGGEVFFGGLGIETNVYIPIKRKQTLTGTSTGQGQLVDRTTGQPCVPNPTSVCDLIIVGEGDKKLVAPFGADLKVSYQIPLGGTLDVVPYVGGYVFENKLLGVQTGVDVSLPLGNGFAITGEAKLTHDRRRTEGRFTAGISFQFGAGSTPSSSYLERRMMRTPDRLQPGMITEKRDGKDIRQGAVVAGKNGNGAVSRVQFVDASNQNLADDIVAAIGDNGMVIFSGAVNAQNATTIEINHNGVAIVGGGQVLQLRGAQDGRLYSGFKTPGTHATITQANNATDVFHANGRQDLFFGGFDTQGGFNGIQVINSPNAHLTDIQGINNANNAVRIDHSVNARLENIFANNANNDGIHIRDHSENTVILNSRSFSAAMDGLLISSTERVQIVNFTSSDDTGNGVNLNNSEDGVLKNVMVTNAGASGILLGMGTKRAMVDNANISGVTRGIFIDQATNTNITNTMITAANFGIDIDNSTDGTKISNTRLNVTAGMAGRAGLHINNSNNVVLDTVTITGSNAANSTGIILTNGGDLATRIQFRNVLVQNYNFGYAFDANSAVLDQSGNRAANITNPNDTCDAAGMADGTVSVFNVNDGLNHVCN